MIVHFTKNLYNYKMIELKHSEDDITLRENGRKYDENREIIC